jgi:hypothetical protein
MFVLWVFLHNWNWVQKFLMERGTVRSSSRSVGFFNPDMPGGCARGAGRCAGGPSVAPGRCVRPAGVDVVEACELLGVEEAIVGYTDVVEGLF